MEEMVVYCGNESRGRTLYISIMKNTQLEAEYIKSIDGTDDIILDNKFKVAFLGRSNVGKSSLINSIVGMPLARSSTRPGKTVKLDFFLVQGKIFFVDLPGYGYAKRSKEDQEHYRRLISWYLFRSGVNHKLVVLIIDAHIGITDYDRESIQLLTNFHIPFLIAANKIDKVKRNERAEVMECIKKECGDTVVIPYSSITMEGVGQLRTEIFMVCN